MLERVFVFALLALLPLAAAFAQSYPTKPIRMLVGFPPGGAADIMARILAPKLIERFQQPVVIDNRAGAGSSVASDITAKAVPDGYTLYMASGSHAINAGLHPKLPYDSEKDFAGIALVASAPLVLVVTNGLPVKSVQDLVALARAKPKQLNYGSSGTGGSSHLATELLASMARIELTHVPYKGAAPALTDLIAGQVQLSFPTVPTALGQIKAGRMRALAVSSVKRISSFPDVPTVAEAGVPGYEATNWYALLAPARTPRTIVDLLNATTIQALRSADVAEAITRQGAAPTPSTPAECDRYLRSEIAKWKSVIRRAGIRPE